MDLLAHLQAENERLLAIVERQDSGGLPCACEFDDSGAVRLTCLYHQRLEGAVEALRLCAFKLKVEYDRQQPDARSDECWAECERAWDVLDSFGGQ